MRTVSDDLEDRGGRTGTTPGVAGGNRCLPATGVAALLAGAMLAGAVLPGVRAGEIGEGIEDFGRPPGESGWRVFGEGDLFRWDPVREAVQVTWDSSQANSYLFRSLGTVLSRADDFGFGFELELESVAVGMNEGKPYTFELAIGLHRQAEATAPDFRRGTGLHSPNLVEWAYFPDSGFGATLWPTVVSREGRFNYSGSGDFVRLELRPGVRHGFWLEFTAADATLRLEWWEAGGGGAGGRQVRLSPQFTDFRVDTLAIRSYSDAGADGSVLARGWVDSVRWKVPAGPLGRIEGHWEGETWVVTFIGRGGWEYELERARDGQSWQPVDGTRTVLEQDGRLELREAAPDRNAALYRVRADKP